MQVKAEPQAEDSQAPATPRVEPKEPEGTKIWERIDKKAKTFRTTKKGGPAWSTVFRRITIDTDTNEIIETLNVDQNTET